MSSGMYLVRDSESRPQSDSVSNYMLTVQVLSQITVFFIVTKPIQYMYKIKDREISIKNVGSLPHKTPLVGQKMARKPRIDS